MLWKLFFIVTVSLCFRFWVGFISSIWYGMVIHVLVLWIHCLLDRLLWTVIVTTLSAGNGRIWWIILFVKRTWTVILKSDPVVRSSRKKVHSLKEHKVGGGEGFIPFNKEQSSQSILDFYKLGFLLAHKSHSL